RCRSVLADVLQVADSRLEAVLYRTQLGPLAVDLLHGAVQDLNGLLCAFSAGDVQVADGSLNHHTSVGASSIGQTQCRQTGTRGAISQGKGLVPGEQIQS